MGHGLDKAVLLPFRDLHPEAEWILQRSKTGMTFYLFPCVQSQLYANGVLVTWNNFQISEDQLRLFVWKDGIINDNEKL